MNSDFYVINKMIDTSISFEMKAKEEKVKMFASIFAFFIVLFIIISLFFIVDFDNYYIIFGVIIIETVGLIFCFILNEYRKDCKGYLALYRKELKDLFVSIFEYEIIIKYDNEFEKHLIKQRLILVNPNV